MTPDSPDFWIEPLRRRRTDTPCPRLVWVTISGANRRPRPWEEWHTVEWRETTREYLRTVVRSPTPFKHKNPDLKAALRVLHLEWLTPSQIGRIRQCPAPRRVKPRDPPDRLFSWRIYRRSLQFFRSPKPTTSERSPKCNRFFWAWRHDQKTCDKHWWAASMLRVEKHRKGKSKRLHNVRQLKDARLQLKRVRRANKRSAKLDQKNQRPPLTDAQLKERSDRADFRLLQSVWLHIVETPADMDDPKRLDEMIKDGYVLPPDAESETYRLSGQGLRLYGELKKRTARPPGTVKK